MRWEQEGRTLAIHTPAGSARAVMPEGWRLADVHPSVIAVSEWLLFHNLTDVPDLDDVLALEPRAKGSANLLSFSGGADSVAALLVQDCTPVYLRRPYDHYHCKGGVVPLPPTDAVDAIMRKAGAVVVDNDFEKLGLAYGKRHGFHDGYGYGAMLILLADFYDAGVLSFGGILDTVWMGTGDLNAAGSRYTDITTRPRGIYNVHKALFAVAGMDLALPVAGCSETITVKLGEPYGAISCPIPDREGNPCRACFKCFRKEQLLGRRADPARIRDQLSKRPLKMASSLIHGCHTVGHFPPEIAEFADVDTSWTERHHDYSLTHTCPPDIADLARERLSGYGIEPMTPSDVAAMQDFMR